MKKFTIAVATVLALGGLNACTSDYVCTCDVTVFGFPVSVDTTSPMFLEGMLKMSVKH